MVSFDAIVVNVGNPEGSRVGLEQEGRLVRRAFAHNTSHRTVLCFRTKILFDFEFSMLIFEIEDTFQRENLRR